MLIVLAGVGLCRAATYYVAPGGDDTRTGLDNWTNALATISNGVFLANRSAGDTVLVSNGIYVLSTNIYITNGITLRGEYGRAITTIDANPAVSNRCVFIDHADAVVEGFTLTGGNMPTSTFANAGYGGGAYMTKGTLNDCIVSNNIGTLGGGVYNIRGLITNCVVCYNLSWGGRYSGGGGIYMWDGFTYDCSIFSNSSRPLGGVVAGSAFGGGVWMNNGLLAGCFVSNNSCGRGGGGVYVGGSGNVISNCLIANNRCSEGTEPDGGGIYMRNCGATIIDTVISNNYGTVRIIVGGGVYSENSTSVFYNCTITGNKGNIGSGICLGGGSMLLTNCVISNNTYSSVVGYQNGGIDSGTYGGSVTAVWCQVANNRGCGIYARQCVLDHCVIQKNNYGNYADAYGLRLYKGYSGNIRNCLIVTNARAGIYFGSNATFNVSACTIADNYNGVGVYLVSDGSDTFTNCVIANNSPDDFYLPTAARSNAFWYSCGNVLTNTAQGNITTAPVFANPSASNWRMTNGSPCLSAGIVEDWMVNNSDLDGRRRIWRGFGRVDMGAYESPKRGVVFRGY